MMARNYVPSFEHAKFRLLNFLSSIFETSTSIFHSGDEAIDVAFVKSYNLK